MAATACGRDPSSGPGETETAVVDGSETNAGDGDGDGDGPGETETDTDTDTDTPAPACGDGNLDDGEACDDGNLDDGDGCSAGCELSGGALLETCMPEPDWPERLEVLTLATVDGVPELQLGGTTQGELFYQTAWVLRLSSDCELLWATSASLPLAAREVTGVEQIDDSGAAWITGWGYDEEVLADGPGWSWLGRIEDDGSWAWLEDALPVDKPIATVVRDDASAVVLGQGQWTGANSLHGFSPTGSLDWSTAYWSSDEPLSRGLALERVGGELLTIGGVWTHDEDYVSVSASVWVSRLSDSGEPLANSVHPSPRFSFASARASVHDPITDTLALAVREYDVPLVDEMMAWVRLDASGETVLAWRSIGPGFPLDIEPDGEGGAYVLGRVDNQLRLGHHGPDEEAPALWEVSNDHFPISLAVDLEGGRAYVLTDSGIDVFML
ncbi:hypothetical protein [Enhygromyxa salina]|uniref:hypothetical protein n=1 Tax=Enhygromyxa salina TaxID=215803 RepID=UPI002467C3A2|nr:hypothetical protein [Enhygromyxa salina]